MASAAANYGGVGVSGGMFNEQNNLQDLMNSFAAASGGGGGHNNVSSMFETGGFEAYDRAGGVSRDQQKMQAAMSIGGSDRLSTRDFLGVGQIVRSMSGGGQREQQHAFNALEAERNAAAATAAPSGQSFGGGGGNFQ